MNIVLLSGGSGQRLWPLSNNIRSKQFLKLIETENGEKQSMLQRVYGQLQETCLADNIVIATSSTQAEAIKNQLGAQVSIAVEPERRNTYPAIALACAFLVYEKGVPEDEPVIILPVDPYVDQQYFQRISKVYDAIRNHLANIALMGVKPTYPSEKYGYIIPGNKNSGYYEVKEFKEKPDEETAQKLIEAGGLWNCGVFSFQIHYILEKIRKLISFSNYQEFLKQYGKLKNTSFDYAIVEKEHSILVTPYEGEWKDLGTWNTLTEVMGDKANGNVLMAEECCNTHAINELEIPLIVMGAMNMIIAASPDGILVAEKEQSSFIKKQLEQIHQRPMFEERGWGDYKVLDMTSGNDGVKSLTKRKKIRAGAEIEYQSHKNRSEVWVVLSGECLITIDGNVHKALTGDTFPIRKSMKHGLKAISEVEILEVQIGEELIEDGTKIESRVLLK